MKIYLAGPLFSMAELFFNDELTKRLREQGHKVFLPQEAECQTEGSEAEIFEADVAGIDQADMVVAIADGSDVDSGTAWEVGYAYALGKQCILVRTDKARRNRTNLMLFEGSTGQLDVEHGTGTVQELADLIDFYCRKEYVRKRRTAPRK